MNDLPHNHKNKGKNGFYYFKEKYCTVAKLFKNSKKWIKKITICPEMKVDECFEKIPHSPSSNSCIEK